MAIIKRLSCLGTIIAAFSLSCGAYNPEAETLPNRRDNRCEIRPDTRQCYVSAQLFYYNSDINMCRSYTWGGCGDYAFDTLAECENSCLNKK